AAAEALAARLDRAVVQRHETPRERKPDADAAAARLDEMLGHLAEHLEHVVEPVLRYAVARVLDAHDGAPVFDAAAHLDAPAGLRVFRRVAEQIADDLREALEIALDDEHGRVDDDVEPVAALEQERIAKLDGGANDLGQIERRHPELHVAA